MEAKPIFIIALPDTAIRELDIHRMQKEISEKLLDYHVLVYFKRTEEVEFKCFYEKDFDEVKYEELKKMVADEIAKLESGTIEQSDKNE